MANFTLRPDMVRTPYYELWMDDKRMSPLLHSLVQSVQFMDSASEASTATIQIADPDFVLLDDPALVRSTKFRVYGGFVNDNRLWLKGYISSVDVNFQQDGPPIVEIMVMDESFSMDLLPRYDLFENMRSDQIAAKIAQRYGFKFVGDPGPRVYKRKIQSKQTDITFLRSMADEEWFLVKVLNGVLYWRARDFKKGDTGKTYWYRRPPFDVISFNPRLVQADRLVGTVDSTIDPATGETSTSTSSSGVSDYTAPDELGLLGELPDDSGTGTPDQVTYNPQTGKWYDSSGREV